jgi:putative peptidoglycan lipid II flippase
LTVYAPEIGGLGVSVKKLSGFISIALLVTVTAKVLGMVREMAQARVFGASAEMDAFSLASSSTVVLFTTLAYALCVAAIPVLSGLSGQQGFRTADNLLLISVLGSMVLALALFILNSTGALPALAGGNGLYKSLASYLIPLLPLITAIYILLSFLQARGHYALQGALSLPYNLAIIAYLFLAGGARINRFVIIVALAWLLQLAVLIPAMVKERYLPRLRLDFKAPYLKSYFKTVLSTILTTSVFYWLFLTDIRFIGRAGPGSASVYYYADKLFTPISTTLLYSVSAVVFPRLGKLASEVPQTDANLPSREYAEYVFKLLDGALRLILPVSALLFAFAPDISRVLFAGGSFSEHNALSSGRVLSLYALGLCGFFMLDIVSKAWFALRRTRYPGMVVAAAAAVNFLSDILVARLFPDAAELPALTSALCLTGGGIALAYALLRGNGLKVKTVYLSAIFSVVLGAVLFAARSLLDFNGLSRPAVVFACVVLGAAGFGIYWLCTQLLRRKT